jgi:hypothetical protein
MDCAKYGTCRKKNLPNMQIMECAKYEMCRIRNVQKMKFSQFGTCNVQNAEEKQKENGMCKIWNVQKMEGA